MYNRLKKLYLAGRLNDVGLENAVTRGWITEDQKAEIIEAKKATYYGIGMALTRITKAILGDEHSVLTVSAVLRGEYDQRDVFTGVPCILNQNGVQRILPLSLTKEEKEKFDASCDILREGYEGIL